MIDPKIFHDVSISKISTEGDAVYIEADEFAWSDSDICPPTRIAIRKFRRITRNGFAVQDLVPESEDGEIYRMEESAGAVTLTIIWNDGPQAAQSAIYTFDHASLEIALL
jgi:hypothetical protein